MKWTTPSEALTHVTDGMRVFVASGAATPLSLVEALAVRGSEVRDVEVCHLLTLDKAPYLQSELAGRLRHNAFFIGANARAAVHKGEADFTPVFLSEIASLFRGPMPVDVALVQVTPPDAHGFCSLGVSVDIVKPALESAAIVIAEVNPKMPRTHGDAFIHSSAIHLAIEVDHELPELPGETLDEDALAIGKHVAGLVKDGDTLQLGIGAVPNALLAALRDHCSLGIHTEMFSDGVMDLVMRGVIDNSAKTLHRGKLVTSFLMGSRALYRFVDDNPMVEMHPSHYVNDPFIVAKNKNMVAVNSALAVDLTGQVCADSLGPRFHSGVGGQVDFIRGAARSPGGRPIIALPSTAKGGKLSRIVVELASGSGVTTTRNDVHFIVTEHGVAALHGCTIRERVKRLVAVAHPKFRDELLAGARERCWSDA